MLRGGGLRSSAAPRSTAATDAALSVVVALVYLLPVLTCLVALVRAADVTAVRTSAHRYVMLLVVHRPNCSACR